MSFLQSSKRKAPSSPTPASSLEPKGKKTRVRLFQDSWKKGRSWLVCDGDAMFCALCKKHAKVSAESGFKRDAWTSAGCRRMRLEVVREHEASKMHRASVCAEQTQRGVQARSGGIFHVQLARRDDTAKLFMKILYWIIKENIALEKWNSMKGELRTSTVYFFYCVHFN